MSVKHIIRSQYYKALGQLAYHRFKVSIRSSDVFIVAYPKSGTTWLSFILANLLADTEITLKDSITYVPNLNRLFKQKYQEVRRFDRKNPNIFKVHTRFDSSLSRVIYILRDPRDVMASYWHHHQLVDPNFDMSLGDFLSSMDDLSPCSWEQHVSGWLIDHDHPELQTVRYEDMKTDIFSVVEEVIRFVGLEADPGTIERAIRASSLENMRRLENQHGMNRIGKPTDKRFVRKGKAGGWKEELSREQVRLIEDRCGSVMEKVDYELHLS